MTDEQRYPEHRETMHGGSSWGKDKALLELAEAVKAAKNTAAHGEGRRITIDGAAWERVVAALESTGE